jgi:hypothetical protein
VHAAIEIDGLAAELDQEPGGDSGPTADRTDAQDLLVYRHLADPLLQLTERNVVGALDVPAVPLVRLPYVEHERLGQQIVIELGHDDRGNLLVLEHAADHVRRRLEGGCPKRGSRVDNGCGHC